MRILVWNIQFFTKRRLDDNGGDTVKARAANAERTFANLMYIITTIEQAQPDVFVVVEPQASAGDLHLAATGGGPDGLIYLLAQMREWMSDNTWDWRLVPPLRMNAKDELSTRTYTECVGVFWRNATMQFAGPWHWTVDGAYPTNLGNAIVYGAPWSATVPGGTTAAGQSRFDNGQKELFFPDEFNRRPFLTHFLERAAPNRTLKLYSVHTSPTTAHEACQKILQINGMAPQAQQITVVAGDFNVKLGKQSTTDWDGIALGGQGLRLITTPQISTNIFARGGPTVSYRPTVVRPRPDATWGKYMAADALDYALVGYGFGANPGQVVPSVAVVNRVAGTPSPPFSTDMGLSLATFPNLPPADNDNYDPLEIFRQRWNYGHIAQPRRRDKTDDQPGDGTSDHLPILVTV